MLEGSGAAAKVIVPEGPVVTVTVPLCGENPVSVRTPIALMIRPLVTETVDVNDCSVTVAVMPASTV